MHNPAGCGREISMRTHFALSLLLLIIAWAAPQSARAAPVHQLEFEGVFSGLSSDFHLAGDHVFRDEASWCDFWTEAFAFPPLACPAVDFRHQVVIASVGMVGGCSSFQIESVERIGSRRSVDVVVKHFYPGRDSNCICTAGVTMASRAVVVKRPIGDVAFVHEAVEFDCPLIPNPE